MISRIGFSFSTTSAGRRSTCFAGAQLNPLLWPRPEDDELSRQNGHSRQKKEERAAGIEPAWPAWKAGTLPLSYARVCAPEFASARPDAKMFLNPKLDDSGRKT
jgi:hypothetical protein